MSEENLIWLVRESRQTYHRTEPCVYFETEKEAEQYVEEGRETLFTTAVMKGEK